MRPTKFSEELGLAICKELVSGKSLRRICEEATIPGCPADRETITDWVFRGESGEELFVEFSRQYARAREMQAEVLHDEILEIADHKGSDIKRDAAGLPVFDEAGNPVIDHDNIQRAKLQIDARFKLAAQLRPKKYGAKLNLGGQEDNPIKADFSLKVEFVKPAKGDDE